MLLFQVATITATTVKLLEMNFVNTLTPLEEYHGRIDFFNIHTNEDVVFRGLMVSRRNIIDLK